MAIIETTDGGPLAAIQELLRSMLSRGVVRAILAPQEVPSHKTVVQTLVLDPDRLDAVNPLAPVLGMNSARIVARMCAHHVAPAPEEAEPSSDAEEPPDTEQVEPEQAEAQAPAEDQARPEEVPSGTEAEERPAPIGVVLRPCETRALVELVKLQQVDLDSFLVIGIDCWGTYSVPDYAAKVAEGSQNGSVTAQFLAQAASGEFPEQLRGACRVCRHPSPPYADLAIQFIGEDPDAQIRVRALSEKGKEAFDALELEETPEADGREAALSHLKETREQLAQQDIEDFRDLISSLCINCHNCRAVCPICYCKQCVFDGQVFEYPLERYLGLSGKKGVLGMPPDKLLFHLTRMSHVATSCAACGQCEAACPSGIPLGRIYQRISSAAQEALDYEAGRSLDDELPLTTFREDELASVET